MRIISEWHGSDKAHTIEEVATTLAFNSWKIGLKAVKSMQDEKLYFVSKSQGLLVIAEFIIFQIQVADRLAYSRMNEQERTHFIQVFAKNCLQNLSDNRKELGGKDEEKKDYIAEFSNIFNERLSEYADFTFDEVDGPSYRFYRYLGEKVGLIMGNDQDNKWAIDQVMDIEAPGAYEDIRKSMDMLYG